MSRRAVLWVAFVVVHVGVAVLGYLEPTEPMGDVYRVYEPWSNAALRGTSVVGLTEPWVYPQLALVPMVLAHAFSWLVSYTPAWAILVGLADAAAFGVLVGRGRSTGREVAAWFWLAAISLLGPVGLYRLEGVTVPLAVLGCLWLIGRPWLGATLLAAATWIKVWPAALVAAAVLAVRRRLAVVGAGAILSGAVVAIVAAAGGGAHVFGFIADQTGRGLQLEAPVSAWYLWRAVAGIPDSFVYYDPDLLTFQVTGPAVDPVIAVMTPLLAIAVLAVLGVGAVKMFRGAAFASLFPALSIALVLAFIVFNKVGSPQYVAWIFAPFVLALVLQRRRWIGPAFLAAAIAGLTQLVYPLLYTGVMAAEAGPVLVLTIRNAALVALFAWSVVLLVRVPVARVPPVRRAPAAAPAMQAGE